MSLLLGVAGFGVDLGSWYRSATRLQNAVDAAALAGVVFMPGDFTTAQNTALAVMRKNGFANGTDNNVVTVSAVAGDDHELKVCTTLGNVQQFFTKVVGAHPRIAKCATARYVLPVAMGSPLNEISNTALGVYPAINGYCSASEDGDEFQSGYRGLFPDHTWLSYTGCPPGGDYGPPLGANPDYDAHGYDYRVDVKAAVATSIDVFDGEWSSTSPYDGVQGNGTTSIDTTYTVTFDNNTPLNRADDVVVATTTIASGDASWQAHWASIATVSAIGGYYVNVRTSTNPESHGTNSYGLRARVGASFTSCSSDVTAANYSATCPQIYGVNHLSVDAQVASNTAQFYLASIGSEHAGQDLTIDLYDPGEGGQSIEVLDPNGDPATFDWKTVDNLPQVAGADAMSGTDSSLDVSGAVTPPDYERNSGTFNDRKVELTIHLPADYAAIYGAKSWWSLRYEFGSLKVRDRTTWSVHVNGDPVRLVGT
jgi:hypothetical protein